MEDARITASQVDSAYAAWEGRARSEWERLLAWEARYVEARPDSAFGTPGGFTPRRGGALDSLRAWAEQHPMTVATTFDAGEGAPDFSAVFGEEAPRIEGTAADSARLIGYAMKLRGLFAEGNAEALYQMHQPRFEAIGFGREKAIRTIAENWLSYDWRTDFEREDVRLRKWSGGRVWELYRRGKDTFGKQALLVAGEKRLATWHKVYVAEMDGELKVVR